MNRRQFTGSLLGLPALQISSRVFSQWREEPVNELPRLAVYRSWWHDRKDDVPILQIWSEAQVYLYEWNAKDAFDFYTIPDDLSVVTVNFCDTQVRVANIKVEIDASDLDVDQLFTRQLLDIGYYVVIRQGNLVFIFGFLSRSKEGLDEVKEIIRSVLDRAKIGFRYTPQTVIELVPSDIDVKSVSQRFVLEYDDVYRIKD